MQKKNPNNEWNTADTSRDVVVSILNLDLFFFFPKWQEGFWNMICCHFSDLVDKAEIFFFLV